MQAGRPWDRRDTLLACILALVAFWTRAAQRASQLYSWDSGLLASGIQEFSFAAGHPHPPYYPLTIAFGKLLAPFVGPVHALTWMAVGASAVLGFLTYAVGRRLASRACAVGAGLVVILSPTALMNGSVPLSYTLEGASSAALALAALWCREEPTRRRAIVVALTLSLAIGIRPSSLFLLSPLALWAVWGHWRRLGEAVVAGAVSTAAWAIPALVAGGGWRLFKLGNDYQSKHVVFADTIFQKGWTTVENNLDSLHAYVPHEFPWLAGMFAAAIGGAGLTWSRWRHDRALPLLAAWLLPPFAFFVFIYAGWPVSPSGYVLVLVPGVAAAAAVLLERIVAALREGEDHAAVRLGAAAAVAVLVVMPAGWLCDWPDAMARVRAVDDWDASYAGMETMFPPETTALVSYYNWHWMRMEQPEYHGYGVQPYWADNGTVLVQVEETYHGKDDRPSYVDGYDGVDDPPHPVPPGIRYLIVIEDNPLGGDTDILKPLFPHTEATLPSGRVVRVIDATTIPTIEYAIRWFTLDGHLDFRYLEKAH